MKQFGYNAYERIERTNLTFHRPICVTGPESDKVATLIADQPQFSLCESFEQILGVCSKVL